MPCAAPCDRLPCDERCTRILKCGHRCPSLCGEDCPNNLCQDCGEKGDARVDFLEWKTYSEINLDETPIIVLGCGHFFTSESVDGVVGLDEVYTRDKDGKFNGLQDVSSSLASAIPSCPDCKQPIRQFVTKRYNRVINRAVMDETSKRFLTKGRTDLEGIERRLEAVEGLLDSTVASCLKENPKSQLRERYVACNRVGAEALILSEKMKTENQPARRLIDAISIYQKSAGDEIEALSAGMKAMNVATQQPDNQISLRARLIYIKAQEVMFNDVCRLLHPTQKAKITPERGLTKLLSAVTKALRACRDLITQAHERSLSRIAIMATISFAKMAQMVAWYHRTHPGQTSIDANKDEKDVSLERLEGRTGITHKLLASALELCNKLGNCTELEETVQEMARLYEGPRYETVTLEELQSIKTAMVSGRGGIATHSGHWYNCENGHPVSNFYSSS
jgi:hypothetical protein